MQIQLLGGVRAAAQGQELTVGPAKAQAALAALALRAGKVVTVAELVDALWGEHPPRTADKTLQTYVGHLRSALGASAIERVGAGYRLTVPADAVDALRFTRALDAGDAVAALAEWTGPPLAGVEAPGLDPEVTALTERWLSAVEQVHADIVASEDPDRAIGDLTALTANHPFREGLWALLMLALYRAGRQSDALRTYAQCRQRLIDELGIEPGPRLRELEVQILRHDPALDPAPIGSHRSRTRFGVFVFTDVEGSTRLWAEYPDEMTRALEEHDHLLRDAAERYGGVVFATGGDSFALAFGQPSHALAFAEEVHAVLADSAAGRPPAALRVRIGVHAGEAEFRGGDYFGPAVNIAARIGDAGHGGQTVVSEAVATLVGGEHLHQLGVFRLKNVPEPQPLYQVGDTPFPRLRTLDVRQSALPAPRERLIGRTAEVGEVRRWLRADRLLTITGVGGCGKTRLAVEVAWEELALHPGGVYFCDLTTVTADDDVHDAVLGALGVNPGNVLDVRDQLATFLGEDFNLVVLDNCEHLLDGVADVVETVLDRCPHTRILATSREAIGVDGERAWRIPSLDVSPGGAAAELFCERSRLADAGLDLDADDERVVDICRQLDGIPLALQLAAARVGSLGLAGLRDRLDDRFRVLSGGGRRRQRQSTLMDMVVWSYQMLDADEQHALRTLAVFSGYVRLMDAAAVLELDEHRALDLVDTLVAKSLVEVAHTADGRVQYRLLETIRLFGLDRLQEMEELTGARDRHLRHFLALAESVDLRVDWHAVGRGWPDPSPAVTQADRENFIAAMLWAATSSRHGAAARLAIMCAGPLLARRHDGPLPWLYTTPEEPVELRQRVATIRAMTHLAVGDVDGAQREAAAGLAIAGDDASDQLLLAALPNLRRRALDPAWGLGELASIGADAVDRGAPPALVDLVLGYYRAACLVGLGEFAEAAASCRASAWLGNATALVLALSTISHGLAGQRDELPALVDAAADADAADLFYPQRQFTRVIGALFTDGPRRAAAILADALDGGLRRDPHAATDAVTLWGWIALEQGDTERARELLWASHFTGQHVMVVPHLLVRCEADGPVDPARLAAIRTRYMTDRYDPVVVARNASRHAAFIADELARHR